MNDRSFAPLLRSVVASLAVAVVCFAAAAWAVEAPGIEFTDAETQTRQFLRYYHDIELTPEQESLKDTALARLPAPCCNDRTAATCCCSCNMAKTWWGLTKHLIADLDYDEDQITSTVAEWFAFTNPAGYSGDACYTGGCGRAFAQNGCGGMAEGLLVF